MGSTRHDSHHASYAFDTFAEYLSVTLAENIARCPLGTNRVKKIRLGFQPEYHWPVTMKVILENDLVVSRAQSQAKEDGSFAIDYMFHCSALIPNSKQVDDKVAQRFLTGAKKIDPDFYEDAWSLTIPGCIPSLILKLAFRNLQRSLPNQLRSKGIDLTPEFNVLFFNGRDYEIYTYDGIKQEIIRQMGFYLTDNKVKALAADCCFSHVDNRDWLEQLT